tara:strand:- start:518 stop:622 length:105 start_codon:yes stop_codon:yes gene_type:complete
MEMLYFFLGIEVDFKLILLISKRFAKDSNYKVRE